MSIWPRKHSITCKVSLCSFTGLANRSCNEELSQFGAKSPNYANTGCIIQSQTRTRLVPSQPLQTGQLRNRRGARSSRKRLPNTDLLFFGVLVDGLRGRFPATTRDNDGCNGDSGDASNNTGGDHVPLCPE